MSKKVLILSFLFIGVILLALATLIVSKTHIVSNLPATPFLRPTTVPSSEVTLSLSPNPLFVIPGQNTAVNVVVESKRNTSGLTLIQMEIGYDPYALNNVTISPGNFFTNPTILLEKINPRTGRISYALETPTETVLQQGTVAIITFTPTLFWARETSLSFLPKTLVRGKGEKNILTATTSAKLIFGTPLLPQASGSGIMPY